MSQEPKELRTEAEAGQNPAPPEELKPWYYQYWFLYPMVVFWPLWPVLIIRSPWHNGLVSGALAWAYLIIFGGLAYFRLRMGGTVALSTLAYAAPGLILTVITQIHWTMNRRSIMAVPEPTHPTASPTEERPGSSRPRRSNRRRGRRRR